MSDNNIEKILIIKYSATGDAVLISPALRAIRKKFPEAFIAILAGPKTREVYKNCPYIDEIIMSDFKGRNSGVTGMLALSSKIKEYDFDISIDIQNNNRSHILAFLSRIPERYGYNRKLGFLCNYGIEDDRPHLPPVRHQFYVLKELGIVLGNDSLELWPDKKDYDKVKELFRKHNIREDSEKIGINVGASKKWSTKNLSPEKIAKLCDKLNDENREIILTGMKNQTDLRDRIISNTDTNIVDFLGKTTFPVLVTLVGSLDLYITPDSAPLHIAAAMGTPVVTYFGPTDPQRHFPPTVKFKVLYEEVPCSPCYSKNCRNNMICMKNIGLDEIARATEELLKNENSYADEAS